MTATVAETASLDDLRGQAREVGADVGRAVQFAHSMSGDFPLPGKGETLLRWRMLAAVAAGDLTVARVLEPHIDALAILSEAGHTSAPGVWGVFAAEQPGVRLTARRDTDGWRLEGLKPWCSLGSILDRALISAHAPDGRRLFEVELGHPSVVVADQRLWVARGLREVVSVPLRLNDTPAEAVGGAGWYLSRPGFSWGGLGVTACWLGAACALGETLTRSAGAASSDPLLDLAIGRVDVQLSAAWFALKNAAVMVDGGQAVDREGENLALRVRAIVAHAAEEVLTIVAHALGPAPLAFDEEHARRVADLSIYLGQHHGERDLAALGRQVRAGGSTQ